MSSRSLIRIWVIPVLASILWGYPLQASDLGVSVSSSGNKIVGKPVAVVNNEPIFQDELEKESLPFLERYQKMTPQKEVTSEKILELKKEVLNRLIEEKLLLQEAKNKKIKITKVEIEKGLEQFKEPFAVDEQGHPRSASDREKQFQEQLAKEGMTQEQFQKRVEDQLMKVRLIDLEVRSKVVPPKDEEAKRFFNKIQDKISGKSVTVANVEEENDLNQISKFLQRMSGEQVRVRHILIRSKRTDSPEIQSAARKKLEGILQKVKNGEDFAFLAKKFSEEPLSQERGGDLGFIAKGDLGLPELEDVIFKLKEGEVSRIVETDFGFHLIKMIERRAPHPIEYEEVSDDLKNFMSQKIFTQKMEKYLKDLRTKSSITVNPI